MNTTSHSARGRSSRTGAARRAQLLADFDRSGLSAAAFARQQGLNYTTFCGWRQRRDQATVSPGFVQVEVTPPLAPVELVIEVGAHARLRVHSESQIDLAARLLGRLNATAPC
jgi:hypothetical protein